MAVSSSSASERDIMAKLAARLMGKTPSAVAMPASSKPVASPIEAKGTPQLQRTNKAPNSEVVNQLPAAASPSKASTPAPACSNFAPTTTSYTDSQPRAGTATANSGPALRGGNADQLAEAREFLSSATGGGSRRGGSRQRLLSKEPDRGPFSDASRLSRPSTAAPASSTGWQSFGSSQRTDPAPMPRANASAATTGLSTLHGRPPVKLTSAVTPTPAPATLSSSNSTMAPLNPNASSFGQGAVAAGSENKSPAAQLETKPASKQDQKDLMDGITKSIDKMALGTVDPFKSSPKKEGSKAQPNWQLADVTNTLKDRASDAKTPPHLRAKAAARSASGIEAAVQVDSGKKEDITPVTEKKPEAELKKESDFVSSLRSAPVEPKAPENFTTEAKVDHQKTEVETTTQDIELRALAMAKEEIATITTRISTLEQDNFTMQKQLDALLQEKERRQFLGTGSAKEPFALEVKCASGKISSVQVTIETKISELIRRVRTQSALAPGVTRNPRIVVDGRAVGHAMMLGEVGVGKDKKVEVAFDYEV